MSPANPRQMTKKKAAGPPADYSAYAVGFVAVVHHGESVAVAGRCFFDNRPPVNRVWQLEDTRADGPIVAEIREFFAPVDVVMNCPVNGGAPFPAHLFPAGETAPLLDLDYLKRFFLPGTRSGRQPDFSSSETARAEPDSGIGTQEASEVLNQGIATFFAIADGFRSQKGTDEATLENPLWSIYQQIVRSGDVDPVFSDFLDVCLEAHHIQWDGPGFVHGTFPELPVAEPGFTDSEYLKRNFRRGTPNASTFRAVELKSLPETLERIDHSALRAGFQALENRVPGFNRREGQYSYSCFVADGANSGGSYAIEAGTGTGKTLGYLLPAFEFARKNNDARVLIATATKNLQEHVANVEIPRLRNILSDAYGGIKVSVLKGKSNYLCMTALFELFDDVIREDLFTADQRLPWLYLYGLSRTTDGNIEDIPSVMFETMPALRQVLDEVRAQGVCTPDQCDVFPSCCYSRQLDTAMDADIVVTNHHKLALIEGDLAVNTALCIVDEADQFPESFRDSCGVGLDRNNLFRKFILPFSGSAKRRGFLQILRANLEKDASAGKSLPELVSRITDTEQAVVMLREDVESLSEMIPDETVDRCRFEDIPHPGSAEQILNRLDSMRTLFDRICANLDNILEDKRYETDDASNENLGSTAQREKRRLARYGRLAEQYRDEAAALSSDHPSPSFVFIFEKRGSFWRLEKLSLDFGEHLTAKVLEPFRTRVFTSATLFESNSLDYFRRELCHTEEFDGERRIVSPFDYDAQVFAAVAMGIPEYSYSNSGGGRLDEVSRLVQLLGRSFGGRALVLFTNGRDAQNVFDQCRRPLEAVGVECLLQEGSGMEKIDLFLEKKNSVLFGVGRLWYGVDFPGETLSLLIIDRLPNPSMGDPIITHRKIHNADSFWDTYYRPFVRLRMKQGFGRLIRSETDRGAFLLLDRRAITKPIFRSTVLELPVELTKVFGVPDSRSVRENLIEPALRAAGLEDAGGRVEEIRN